MTLENIKSVSEEFFNESPHNFISKNQALSPDITGMRIFEAPIIGIAPANDDYIASLKTIPEAGIAMDVPEFWLPGAKSVLSFFFRFTERVIEKNTQDAVLPAQEWLHGRIEGQQCINAFMAHIRDFIIGGGHETVVPSLDERYWGGSYKDSDGQIKWRYTSNWSERHAAYACGLGTFGLSKGLITNSGVAGRFGSLITTLEIPITPRKYSGIYDYCIMCGACAENCPANAISIEHGKNHDICAAFVDETSKRFAPYYGCGKCQVGVPCERGRGDGG